MRQRWSAGAVVVGAVLVVAAVVLGRGWGSSTAQEAQEARTDALWRHRTAVVGDNSAVIALATDAGFGAAGRYTLHLHTAREPYALTVEYASPTDGTSRPLESLEDPAVALLGTVGNLGRVEVRDGTSSRSWTTADASRLLGYDVKQLGRDRSRLDAFAERLGPTSDG